MDLARAKSEAPINKVTGGARRGESRVSPFLAWGDFHARSLFACFTIPEENGGLLVVY